jgi:LPS-assembly protein
LAQFGRPRMSAFETGGKPFLDHAWPIAAVLGVALLVVGPDEAAAQSANPGPISTSPSDSAAEPAAPPQRALLEADSVMDDREGNQLVAEGAVEAYFDGRTLRADKVVYNLTTGRVRASGSVQIIDTDGSVRYADEIEVDEELADGVATGFSTRLSNGATAAAAAAVRQEGAFSQLDRIVYTACPVCQNGKSRPTWTIRARQARQDVDRQMISYRDAVFEVRGVPVFYTPYFTHPDPTSERRSGFLFPDGGQSGRVGAYAQIPYYWAISPSQDLTISPLITEKVNPLLGLDYRRRFWSGTLSAEGSFTQEQEFDGDGNRSGEDQLRGHLFAKGDFKISDNWRWGFGVERATDDLYLRRYDIDGENEDRGLFRSETLRLMSQVNLVGQTPNGFTSASAIAFQGLRAGDDEDFFPTVGPLIEAYRTIRAPVVGGQVRLAANAASLTRQEGADSHRVSARASWQRSSAIGPGLVLTPFAEIRGDYYNTNDVGPSKVGGSFGRGLGLAGVEARWPLARPLGSRGTLVIEPTIVAGFGTEAEDDPRIPVEDGLAFEVDESSIFRPNSVPGFDQWESGSRVAAGIRATATFGRSETSLSVGQRWLGEPSATLSRFSNLDRSQSDYVGSASFRYGRNLQTQARFRFDQDSLELTRLDLSALLNVWRVDANMRYLRIDDSLRVADTNEELYAGLGFRVNRNWSVGYGLRRDIENNRNIRQDGTLTFTDDCTFIQLLYTRSDTNDRLLGPSDSVRIRFGFATLGSFGRN